MIAVLHVAGGGASATAQFGAPASSFSFLGRACFFPWNAGCLGTWVFETMIATLAEMPWRLWLSAAAHAGGRGVARFRSRPTPYYTASHPIPSRAGVRPKEDRECHFVSGTLELLDIAARCGLRLAAVERRWFLVFSCRIDRRCKPVISLPARIESFPADEAPPWLGCAATKTETASS